MARICPICSEKALEERRGEYVLEWPQGFALEHSAFPDAEWEACRACGEEILSAELSRRIEAEQYRIQGLFTPAKIRAVRERTGLSQVGMARLLGVGDKSYARWEAGLSVQNKSMDNLIRLAAEHPELFAELDAQREPDRDRQVATYIERLPTLKAQNELAMAAHGDLPSADVIRKIRRRLQALMTAREDSHDATGT